MLNYQRYFVRTRIYLQHFLHTMARASSCVHWTFPSGLWLLTWYNIWNSDPVHYKRGTSDKIQNENCWDDGRTQTITLEDLKFGGAETSFSTICFGNWMCSAVLATNQMDMSWTRHWQHWQLCGPKDANTSKISSHDCVDVTLKVVWGCLVRAKTDNYWHSIS